MYVHANTGHAITYNPKTTVSVSNKSSKKMMNLLCIEATLTSKHFLLII